MRRIRTISSLAVGVGLLFAAPAAAQDRPVVIVIESVGTLDAQTLRDRIGQASGLQIQSLLDVSPDDASEVLTMAIGAERLRMQYRSPYGARSFAEIAAPESGRADTGWIVAAASELLRHARGPGAFRMPSEVLDPFEGTPHPVATSYRLPTEVLDPWSSGRPMHPLEPADELTSPEPAR